MAMNNTVVGAAMSALLFGLAAPNLANCLEPSLMQGLPDDVPSGERVFDFRLKQRFPDGSPEAGLIQELHRQGFRPRYGDDSSMHVYHRTRMASLLCEREWIVTWAPTSDGRIRGIAGSFDVTCP